jgi:hypothetical protein
LGMVRHGMAGCGEVWAPMEQCRRSSTVELSICGGRAGGSSPSVGFPLVGYGSVGCGALRYGLVWRGCVPFGGAPNGGSQGGVEVAYSVDYSFVLRSKASILFHADDVMLSDELAKWRKDPANKSISVPGDDRSPPWTWQTYLHHDGEHVALPQECLMKALSVAGAKITYKGQTTFKSMSQSGIGIMSEHCRFTTDGKQISMVDILKLRELPFPKQVEGARKLGFNLNVKRAKPEAAKGKWVKVRPEFDPWEVEGVLVVDEPAITEEVLRSMFEIAGKRAGLLDWRPSAPKSPGPHGTFYAEIKPYKASRKAG